MRALLLAAGLGTRLRPLTDHLPKCLVPIHGRPLLDYWLALLLDHGVEEVLINTHYMAPLVLQYLDASTWRSRVKVVHEESLAGTGGTLLENRAFFREETCLVAHADNLTLFDMADFARCHALRAKGVEMTMMVFESDDPGSCGIVELDADGVVQGFHEKVSQPPGNLANAAVYLVEPPVLDMMAGLGKTQIDFSTEVIPRLLGRMGTYCNVRYHRDIGNPRSWMAANRDFPLMPAKAENQQAWDRIMAQNNGELARSIDQFMTDFQTLSQVR
ncbi:MAG: nucleotidyltransferase family protein [Rhodocyclaceae bacterium]|nr:MAG: nucleotidyltransferase family protein [Rhodocyclaceae bacterium]